MQVMIDWLNWLPDIFYLHVLDLAVFTLETLKSLKMDGRITSDALLEMLQERKELSHLKGVE